MGCNSLCDFSADILFDKRQRQIEARCYAGRGPYFAVADVESIYLNYDIRKEAVEFIRDRPVRSYAACAEETGRGENDGAAADRAQSPNFWGALPEPLEQCRFAQNLMKVRCAGDKQRVKLRNIGCATEFICDTESELLFNHSSRVYLFGAIAGGHRNLKFDSELLYTGAMFHDFGLMPGRGSTNERFEVDGANAARGFLKTRGVQQSDIDDVWNAIALHTTPGIPKHMNPVVALVTAGVEMDVLGLTYDEYSDVEREAVVRQFPRTQGFKEDIIQALV